MPRRQKRLLFSGRTDPPTSSPALPRPALDRLFVRRIRRLKIEIPGHALHENCVHRQVRSRRPIGQHPKPKSARCFANSLCSSIEYTFKKIVFDPLGTRERAAFWADPPFGDPTCPSAPPRRQRSPHRLDPPVVGTCFGFDK